MQCTFYAKINMRLKSKRHLILHFFMQYIMFRPNSLKVAAGFILYSYNLYLYNLQNHTTYKQPGFSIQKCKTYPMVNVKIKSYCCILYGKPIIAGFNKFFTLLFYKKIIISQNKILNYTKNKLTVTESYAIILLYICHS